MRAPETEASLWDAQKKELVRLHAAKYEAKRCPVLRKRMRIQKTDYAILLAESGACRVRVANS